MGEKKWSVYKHTFPDGKMYIGCSADPIARWCNGYGYSGQQMVYQAIIRYGWFNIKHEIIKDGLEEDESRRLERKLIEKEDQKKLYNSELYKNGRIISEKKDKLDYCIGGGTSIYELETLMTLEQIEKMYKKIGGMSSFIGIENDCVHAKRFAIKGNIASTTEWKAYYPKVGVTYRRFGEWVADEAEFVVTFHDEHEIDLQALRKSIESLA